MDQSIIKEFKGTHPKVVEGMAYQMSKGLYQGRCELIKLTKKQKKHRLVLKLEKLFGIELSKKHYKLV